MLGLLASQAHEPASPGVMILFVVIMMATYVGVAYEGMHKTVAALLGGGIMVLLAVTLGVFEYTDIYGFLQKDLNVFGVIIGTGILVDVVGKDNEQGEEEPLASPEGIAAVSVPCAMSPVFSLTSGCVAERGGGAGATE